MRLSTLAVFLLAPLAANATVLLEINVYNPAAVSISSTGAFSDANDTSHTLLDGIDLVGFLTGATLANSSAVLGNLTPNGDSTVAYNRIWWDDYSGSLIDLNLYNLVDPSPLQSFSTSDIAFTGSASLDLTTVSALLPKNGVTGTLYAGYSGNDVVGTSHLGAAIGEWRVVAIPEPSTYAAFLGVGALAAAVVLRRRRS